jgi:chlorite dismutase/nitrite reductase/ring-hydroxylating ferredoxin subunit
LNRPSYPAKTVPNGGHKLTKRQYVRFAFYKIDPVWRRLPPEEQVVQKRELLETIESFNQRMLLRPYSLTGTRSDVDLLLWQITERLEPFQELATAIAGARMGGYLTIAHSLLSQTKRSIYDFPQLDGEEQDRLVVQPTEAKYLFVYPFLKTRPWYHLTQATRQGMMNEHVDVGRKYPSVKLNTTYSFGIDDQEFVVAFETDEPADFLDLVQDLRETQASLYTLRDTPLYSCIKVSLAEALDCLGGPKIAAARPPEIAGPTSANWVDAGALVDFPPGATKMVYLDGQQVAVFNVEGELFAINNRCSHARGPLSEGVVERQGETCTVVCPWHYARYDLESGRVVDGIAAAPVATYRVEVRDGVIFVGHATAEALV